MAVEYFSFNPSKCDVWNPCQVRGGVATSHTSKEHCNLPKFIKFNLKWRLTSNRNQKNQGRSAKKLTWLPSWNFLTISKKKFTKQIILGWDVFIESKYVICTIWIGFLVIKLKCSPKYNSSPIFFDTHFMYLVFPQP